MTEALEVHEIIRDAIAQSSGMQKEVFRLIHYESLPTREVAEVLGIAEGTVKIHHHRATKKLLPALIEALKDENERIRANAASALKKIGTPEALEALEAYHQ